ncbi:MAG: hypothetical protein KBS81_01435, partial [Spirochaetales bacterium]|nr:hypothetical protein [Candidatus Physcosoma equi]
MKKTILTVTLCGLVLSPIMALGNKEATAPALTSAATTTQTQTPSYAVIDKDSLRSQFSYAYGTYIMEEMISEGITFNSAYFFRGLYD